MHAELWILVDHNAEALLLNARPRLGRWWKFLFCANFLQSRLKSSRIPLSGILFWKLERKSSNVFFPKDCCKGGETKVTRRQNVMTNKVTSPDHPFSLSSQGAVPRYTKTPGLRGERLELAAGLHQKNFKIVGAEKKTKKDNYLTIKK